MKNYWDYSEMERSELTEDQIKSLLDVELMTAGALKPVAPKLKEVSPNPLGEKAKFFNIQAKDKYGSQSSVDVCFANIEDANKFLALKPFIRDYEYEIGSDYYYAKPITEAAIKVDELYSQEQINSYRSVMKQRRSATEENERLTKLYTTACAKSEKITEGVWKDWYACHAQRGDMQAVVDTFKDYLKLTEGNSELALTFLAKAFDAETIESARQWFPDQIAEWLKVADGAAHCPDPVPMAETT